ncbi:MAG: nucleotide-diphospho-sugar transferase [Bacteroidota bacterium]
MSTTVPILFLVFNRPEHTRRTLERIRAAAPTRLYVHCDGPRADKPGEATRVAEVREIIGNGVDWNCTVKTLYRDTNFGLRAGVYDAINWFFREEPFGIVLEDDCLPDLSFFPFCAELLERYADNEQVMHIGCSNLAERFTANRTESYLFSRFSFVWGWASWRRAWQRMSVNLDGLEEYKAQHCVQDFISDRAAQTYMLDKFQVTARKENNSWAYAWFYSILKNKGLCIVPSVNLIQNTGVGAEDATHTTGSNKSAMRKAQTMQFPLRHPGGFTIDPILEKHFFYTSQKTRLRLRLWYLLKQLGLR